MGISVKHGGNPGIMIQAQFAAGRENARRKAEMEALQAKERRDALASQQTHQVALQGSSQQHALESMRVGNQFHRENMVAQNELTRGNMELQSDLGRQAAVSDSMLHDASYEFKLTADQKAQQDQLVNAEAALEMNDDFTPEYKAIGKQAIWEKRAGIKPIPRLKDPSPYPEGQGPGQIWQDKSTGNMITRDPKTGMPKKVADGGMPTHKDVADYYRQARESLTKEVSDGKGGTKLFTPTAQETKAEAMNLFRAGMEMRKEFMKMQQGEAPPAGRQAAPGQQPAEQPQPQQSPRQQVRVQAQAIQESVQQLPPAEQQQLSGQKDALMSKLQKAKAEFAKVTAEKNAPLARTEAARNKIIEAREELQELLSSIGRGAKPPMEEQ